MKINEPKERTYTFHKTYRSKGSNGQYQQREFMYQFTERYNTGADEQGQENLNGYKSIDELARGANAGKSNPFGFNFNGGSMYEPMGSDWTNVRNQTQFYDSNGEPPQPDVYARARFAQSRTGYKFR